MSHFRDITKNKCHIWGIRMIFNLIDKNKRLPLYKKGGSLEKLQYDNERY